MRIHFERTGGFAGMRVAATIDTQSLSPEQANEIEDMVKGVNFFDLPGELEAPDPGADRFQYRLTINTEGRTHTIEVGEAAAPDELRPLLRKLTVMARSSRSS